jgi:hypothetical protein
MNAYRTHVHIKVLKSVSNLSTTTNVIVNLVGWAELVKRRLIFAKINHAKTEEYAQTMKMPTFVNVPKGTVATTASITEKYVIEAHVNMVVHVSAIQMDMTDIAVFVHLEQLETTAKWIREMSVPTVLAKTEPNVLIELETLIVTAPLNIEVKTAKHMINHLLVE